MDFDDNNLNLPSDKCYNELDTKYVDDGNDEKCENLGKHSGKYTKAALLCMGLKGNLEKYDVLNIFGKMHHYKCKYLSMWAHDRLSKLNKAEKATIMSTLLGIWSKSTNFKKCGSSDFPAYVDDTDYVKEKSLYDYALNYEYLENICKNSDDIPCTRKLAEYITESKNLYNEVKSECEAGRNNPFQRSCYALNDIQKIYTTDELLKLECKHIENNLRSLRQRDDGRHGLQGEFTDTYPSGSLAPEVASSDSHKAIGTAVPILGVLSIGFILHKVYINKI
ncbi:PIR Superfamily Protein [Plasmodium ovale curtisi]|uniref:PIR Superfamily Protein n=1 Tax=Plasmodium ovale curtisi TaxID=864141 RepID=A0A1A8XA92_PLAOA|nr:PIR Superfamily Protein [Plasmodium ovale curtisi]